MADSLLRRERGKSEPEQSYFGESPAGVFCLCEKPNDIRMWSHYSASHAGVCIGLSTEIIHTKTRLAKVDYRDSMPVVPLKVALKAGPASFLSFLCKSNVWKYEAEWRCFNQSGAHSFPVEIVKTVIFGSKIPDDERSKLMSIIRGYKHDVTVLQARLKRSDYGIDFDRVEL